MADGLAADQVAGDPTRVHVLISKARVAEAAFRFREAFHWFALAADGLAPTGDGDDRWLDRRAEYMMRAARCLEMDEQWRAQSGSWEWLANDLGQAVDRSRLETSGVPGDDIAELLELRYKVPSPLVPPNYFYVTSDAEWRDPPAEAYQDTDGVRRHQRASAFQWAAEHARAAGEHVDAARLFRRAGVAWEQSHRHDRHSRAAECYFQASLSAVETRRFETRRGILEPWCPACLREKSREKVCQHDSLAIPDTAGETAESDLVRIERCSRDAVLAARREVIARKQRVEAAGEQDGLDPELQHPTKRADEVYEESRRQLAAIQRAVATHGSRGRALEVYRFRHMAHRRHLKRAGRDGRSQWLREEAMWRFSRNGSSLGWTMAALLVLYLMVFPALWWASHSVKGGAGVAFGPAPLEAVVFSASSVMTLTTGHFAAGGWLRNLFQALEALSAVFAFGYLLWIAQRSYDD